MSCGPSSIRATPLTSIHAITLACGLTACVGASPEFSEGGDGRTEPGYEPAAETQPFDIAAFGGAYDDADNGRMAYCPREAGPPVDCSDAPQPELILSLSDMGLSDALSVTLAVDDRYVFVSALDHLGGQASTLRLSKPEHMAEEIADWAAADLLVVGDRLFARRRGSLWSMRKDGTDMQTHSVADGAPISAVAPGPGQRIFVHTHQNCSESQPSSIFMFDPATAESSLLATDACINTFALGVDRVLWVKRSLASEESQLRSAPIAGGPASTLITAPRDWEWYNPAVAGSSLYASATKVIGSSELVRLRLDGSEPTCAGATGLIDLFALGDVAAGTFHDSGQDCLALLGGAGAVPAGDITHEGSLLTNVVTDGEFLYGTGIGGGHDFGLYRLPMPN